MGWVPWDEWHALVAQLRAALGSDDAPDDAFHIAPTVRKDPDQLWVTDLCRNAAMVVSDVQRSSC